MSGRPSSAPGEGAAAQPTARLERPTRTALHVATIALARGAGLGVSLLVSVLMANRFGASAQADAFFVARNLVLDGVEAARRIMLLQLVPLFVAAERAGTGRRMVGRTALAVFAVGALIAGCVALGAETAVHFLDIRSERAALVARLLQVFALLAPMMLVIAVLGGALMARRRFGRAEFALIAPRCALALSLLLLVPPLGVTALAGAMVAGAIVALFFVAVAARRALREATAPDREPPAITGGGRTLAITGVAQGQGQCNLWLDYAFVSLLPAGAFAALDYGQRLMQLLPGVIASSIATVLLTEMARQGSESKGRLPTFVSRTAISGLVVVAPLAAALGALAPDIVQLLLGHGAFSPQAVDMTAAVMIAFAPAVPIGMLMNVLFVALIADADTFRFRPVVALYVSVFLVRAVLLATLTDRFGVVGVPLAGAIASFILVASLCARFRSYGRAFLTRDVALALTRIAVSCGALVVTVLGLREILIDDQTPRLVSLVVLAAIAGSGGAVYIMAATVLGLEPVRAVVRRLWVVGASALGR